MLSWVKEFPGTGMEILEDICVLPDDPPRMQKIMGPYMETRKAWLQCAVRRGLWVAVALGPEEEKQGLIECVPISHAAEPVRGSGSLFINCLWVLPAHRRVGVAHALTELAIHRARARGGISVLAYEGDRWFGYFPYMPASFFQRFGFQEQDRDGSRVLLHLDLGGAHAPQLLRSPVRSASSGGRAVVEVLYNSQCPWCGWMVENTRRGVAKYQVELRLVNTDERAAVEEYGLTRGVFVNGIPVLKRMASWPEISRAMRGLAYGENPAQSLASQ